MILNGVPIPASVTPTLRPMQPSDVVPAAEMILGQGWGVRREWLEFATTQSACVPLVAEAEGRIVATGVGTANGPVGWIGTIFVAPERRGQGLGRAITQAIIDRLDAAGCVTLVLVATSEGRRLYERMGFEVQTRYRILEAPGLPDGAGGPIDAGSPAVRAFAPGDLPAMAELDGVATGEDRAHALARLATPETARVVAGDDGAVRAFVVRPPWGGGATVAASIDAALAIVAARRVIAGPEGRVRVGILAENRKGHAALTRAGFRAQWSAPRMIRGAPLAGRPETIWGQFNHAMG
jgi:GNAT superfamily N-acetyltransferase